MGYEFTVSGKKVLVNFYGRPIDDSKLLIMHPKQLRRGGFIEILLPILKEILEENKHLVLTNPFTINISFATTLQLAKRWGESLIIARIMPGKLKSSNVGMEYLLNISTPDSAYFIIPRRTMEYTDEALKVSLRHELTHHFDKMIKILRSLEEKIKFGVLGFDEKEIISTLFRMFFNLRAEIPTTISEVEQSHLFIPSTKYQIAKRLLISYLNGKISFEFLANKIFYVYHETARTISSILFLYYYLTDEQTRDRKPPNITYTKTKKRFLFIRPRNIFVGIKKEENQELTEEFKIKFRELFEKADFEVDFSWTNVEAAELKQLIATFIQRITQLGHLGLMQEFEKAMIYLGIAETFFSVKFYARIKEFVYAKARKIENAVQSLSQSGPAEI